MPTSMDAIAALLDEVAPILGEIGLISEAEAIEPWLSDWRGRVHGVARAILAPQSTAQLATIVALAALAAPTMTSSIFRTSEMTLLSH